MESRSKGLRTALFGEENRRVRLTLTVMALLGLMVWFAFAGPQHDITFEDCLAEPQRYDGKQLSLSIERVKGVEGDYLVIGAGKRLGRVLPPERRVPPGVARGVTISAAGVFRADGVLEATWIHVHEARPWKNRASFVGMVGALTLGAVLYRWDRTAGGLVERRARA